MYVLINAMYDALAMNVHVTPLHKMTKLPIKQYQSSTTPKIHRETIPTKSWATNFTVPANLVRMTYTVQVLHLWYTKVKSYLPKIIAHLPKARSRIV